MSATRQKKKCSFLARYSLAPCKKQKKAHTRVYTPRLSFSTFRLLSEKKKRKSKPALVHRTISNYQFQTSLDVWNQDHFSIWNFQGRQRLTCDFFQNSHLSSFYFSHLCEWEASVASNTRYLYTYLLQKTVLHIKILHTITKYGRRRREDNLHLIFCNLRTNFVPKSSFPRSGGEAKRESLDDMARSWNALHNALFPLCFGSRRIATKTEPVWFYRMHTNGFSPEKVNARRAAS